MNIDDIARQIASANDFAASNMDITLVRAVIEHAVRLGLIWQLRPGTMVGTTTVRLDGATTAIPCTRIGTGATNGQRVLAFLSPPAGCHVILMA